MSRGGGGQSGKVGFPAYMETQHELWLDSAASLVTALIAGASPYNTALAYNPTADIAAVQTRYNTFDAIVTALSPTTDLGTFVDTVVAKIDEELLPTDYIDQRVEAYEIANTPAYFRALNRFAAGMSDINAVHGSAFVIGGALMEIEFQNQIDGYTAQISEARDKMRTAAILQGVNSLIQLQQDKLQSGSSSTALLLEMMRAKITAFSEQYQGDLEIDVHDLMWDFDILRGGGDVLASISGAPSGPLATPKLASVLGGATSGASQWAMTLGSAMGPEGAILGLLMGGGIGGLGGLIGG